MSSVNTCCHHCFLCYLQRKPGDMLFDNTLFSVLDSMTNFEFFLLLTWIQTVAMTDVTRRHWKYTDLSFEISPKNQVSKNLWEKENNKQKNYSYIARYEISLNCKLCTLACQISLGNKDMLTNGFEFCDEFFNDTFYPHTVKTEVTEGINDAGLGSTVW